MTSATTGRLASLQQELDRHTHGRVPRLLRRRHILAVAEALFIERGYAGASMDELAARAGVSKPVVYDLVGPKESVFAACMEEAADDLAGQVGTAVEAAGHDAFDRLRAGALAWFEFIDARRAVWDALLGSPDAPTTAAVEAIRHRQDAFVAAELLAKADAEGRDVDPELVGAVATAMNGAFEALGRWWHAHPDRTAAELAELYTAMVLPGLVGLVEGD